MRVPGGAPLACVWGVRGQELSYPRPLVLWGVLRGPLPTGCGCGGCSRGDPSPHSQHALLQAGFARCGGGTKGAQGGRLLPVCGASGLGRSPTPNRPSFGACGRCPLPTGCGCRGCGRGDPSPTHSTRSCELALRAVGAARGHPGEAPLAWVWGVQGWALSHPRLLVLSGARPGPATHWLWVRGARAWRPVINPTARALASWLCALWGGHKGARGGHLLPGRGASGVGRSPGPDCSSFGPCGQRPLPTGCGCGGCGRWDQSPTPQRALLRADFARCRGGTRAPRGVASCLGVGRPGPAAVPFPTARPLGGAAGAHYPLAVGARGAGVGTRHQPHSVRSCELALRTVGAARGRPGGASLACVWGVRGRGLSHSRPPVLLGVRPGPTTHWLWVRGVWAWGPVTNPTARALASWLCTLWGRHEGARGGAPLACVWVVRGRALSHSRPLVLWGMRPGPSTHWLWVRGVWAWGPITNPTARVLVSWLCTLWGRHEGARGGASCLCVGRPGSGALLPPTARPLGGAPGPTTHWLWVRGVQSWDPSPHSQHALLRAGFARCGGGTKGAQGGRLLPVCGASGVGRSPTPNRPSFGACGRCPLPTGCGCRGCGRGDPSPTHSTRSCELALRAVGAARGHPGEAPLAWVWGVQGWALSHPRLLVLSGARPGPATHWLWVRGARAWRPVINPTARALASWLCALWGGHKGARGGHLLPGRGASGVGRSPGPDCSSFGPCGQRPLPTGCGCGGCGRWDLSPTPQRPLLRAGFAFCKGGTRAPGRGASCLGVGRPELGALPLPTALPLGRAAGAHYPLAVGAGPAGLGTPHQPDRARSCELALRALGAARGRPGGAPLAWGWGLWGQVLSLPRPLVLWGVRPGPTTHWLWVQGAVGVGTRHQPHSARSCQLSFARLGGGMRAPGGGGASCLGVGRPGSGTSPFPTARPLGPGARAGYPLAVGAGGVGVGTHHQPHSARSCELALYAVGAARGCPGGAPLACVWGIRGRALSHPRPLVLWGVLPGPTTHWLWVRGVRA